MRTALEGVAVLALAALSVWFGRQFSDPAVGFFVMIVSSFIGAAFVAIAGEVIADVVERHK